MKSLRELYRIGKGPSSSHTMGPEKAAKLFSEKHPDAARYEVTLYGSLAATGKGHLTDKAIKDVLKPLAPVEIIWEPQIELPYHPNGMQFKAFDAKDKLIDDWTVYSVGGGALSEGDNDDMFSTPEPYPLNKLEDIMNWCLDNGKQYWEYVEECEDEGIWDFLQDIWEAMQRSVENGLEHEGVLPGQLHLPRKAANYYIKTKSFRSTLQSRGLVFSYALAVSEENAAGGTIVTAPTCGSCGVVPGVLYHLSRAHGFSDKRIQHALATAGLIGNIVKQNASISGAEVGCQGEVGVACAMASCKHVFEVF